MTVQPSTRSDSRLRSPVTLRACAFPALFNWLLHGYETPPFVDLFTHGLR